MSYLIGIDPGISGAIVILQSRACPFPIEWMRMPTLKVGKSSRVDCAALARYLTEFDCGTAYVEAVHAMPGNGACSMFTFGNAAGVVEGGTLCVRDVAQRLGKDEIAVQSAFGGMLRHGDLVRLKCKPGQWARYRLRAEA